MISFRNDYSEGAHPKILAALEQNNLTTTCGYSMDPFCDCLLYTSPSPRDS